MRLRTAVLLAAFFSLCASADAAVRIMVKGGKRIVYNDGVGESRHEALRWSDNWLVARVAIPSLYDDMIALSARANFVDPKLVKSIMLVESAFNPRAVSPKGARGLMQLMPTTAAAHGVKDIHDPAENIAGGTRYLGQLLGLFGGNLEKSLAAYNAGENAVLRYGGVPPYAETRLYVQKALTAYYGKSTLPGMVGTLRPGRPVRLVRDSQNRVLLTTDRVPAARPSERPRRPDLNPGLFGPAPLASRFGLGAARS